ncbi:SRPBCC family protein [Actinopolymorpha alba]|uniref:SRPBCC family protein n=1 Tax=Actinopolymorpha alba TaxID=533267 RepID=UPI00036D9F7E|nr:SRPBCC family protein [Actinopolymorpha alba]
MSDILDQINAVARTVDTKRIPAGEGRTIVLSRTYDAKISDVWDALTTTDRISRWLLPVEGDLRLGGTYQLKDNARGEILVCEPPHLLKATWIYGENVTDKDVSEVEVRLTAIDGSTELVLEHAAVIPDDMWEQYGPGAGGVGWDLALVALGWHLGGLEFDVETWESSADAKRAATRSSQAWGEVSIAAGEPADAVAKQVAGTTEFYTSG